ncbi:MAG: M56 family metallopeptidase [Vicinamibacterales bacterium]
MTAWIAWSALRASALLALGLMAAWGLRRRSAAMRHWTLTATLVASVALPLLSLVLPTWHLSVAIGDAPATAPPPASVGGAVALVIPEHATAVAAPEPAPSGRPSAPWQALGWLWAAGAALLLARLVVGLLRVRALVGASTPLDASVWREDRRALTAALGFDRDVRLLTAARPLGPLAAGAHRPIILLPPDAAEWSAARRRVVLAHELAHIARGDWLAHVIAEIACAVYWCTPLAWAVARRARVDCERAADDAVLHLGLDATDYASHLLDLARALRARSPWTPAPAMARSSSLEGRVRAMLDPTTNRQPASRTLRAAAVVGLLAAAIPLAAAGPQPSYHEFGGVVVDGMGRPIPDQAVVMTDPANRTKHEVRTDAAGRFQFTGLPAGEQHVTVKSRGFRDLTQPVRVGEQSEARLQLALGTLQETVRVTAGSAAAPDDGGQAASARAARAAERQARALETCQAGPPSAAGGNILPPIKLVHVAPAYPAWPADGTVTLTAVIDTHGDVRDVRDVHGPDPALETAAADAVRRWKFTTTLLDCQPTDVEMTVRVNFVAPR